MSDVEQEQPQDDAIVEITDIDSLDGIALVSPQPNPGTTPTPSSSQAAVAYCLHRFGVTLAANALAQRYWPYLPVADAREQLLAQQLAALVSGPPS